MELREAFVKRKGRFKLLERSLAAAGFPKAAPLLEVGCATGEGSAHLAELGYTCVTGVDIDAEAIAQAREKFPGVCFVCADARSLPFAAGSFEGIISEAAFSVIDGKAEAAREYARVLAPGGLVLLHDFAAAAEMRTPSRASPAWTVCRAWRATVRCSGPRASSARVRARSTAST